MTDWATISSLATAGATLLLAGAPPRPVAVLGRPAWSLDRPGPR